MNETPRPLPPRLLDVTTFVLARLGRIGRAEMGRVFAGHGLAHWHFAVLTALDDAAHTSQRELGARLKIDPSDLVDVLGVLEDAGLVVRERDPADRRRHVVALTPAGRTRLDQLSQEAAQADGALLTPLTEPERRAFEDQLRRLLAHHDPAAPFTPAADTPASPG
ncbi:winged helix-turn-helix transcriptional regulator [Actinomadura barringtoniae]|uniref:Winged helix-turn-helix transcriptional regulator n=1 Tax=Actinomadura barringtoniae TaxID=1427535 RepID=A0A939PNS3_9ACTN|nr:MarR family winged helix-turn-helix transcriptional regulator [Actinomadura barringtoniae]MBO2453329.1 winged helix-turn-helix transcriptional regulator [Actinomadura barringtoniae]